MIVNYKTGIYLIALLSLILPPATSAPAGKKCGEKRTRVKRSYSCFHGICKRQPPDNSVVPFTPTPLELEFALLREENEVNTSEGSDEEGDLESPECSSLEDDGNNKDANKDDQETSAGNEQNVETAEAVVEKDNEEGKSDKEPEIENEVDAGSATGDSSSNENKIKSLQKGRNAQNQNYQSKHFKQNQNENSGQSQKPQHDWNDLIRINSQENKKSQRHQNSQNRKFENQDSIKKTNWKKPPNSEPVYNPVDNNYSYDIDSKTRKEDFLINKSKNDLNELHYSSSSDTLNKNNNLNKNNSNESSKIGRSFNKKDESKTPITMSNSRNSDDDVIFLDFV